MQGFLLLAALLAPCAATRSLRASHCGRQAYADFKKGNESASRFALFQKRCRAVLEHNANRYRRWHAALNDFADRTDDELNAFLGYRRTDVAVQAALWSANFAVNFEELPETADWRGKTMSGGFVRDQGECGSCWAMASAGALEMHFEIAGNKAEKVAAAQLVGCVRNPRSCGGSGGCGGATAQLAFSFSAENGVVLEGEGSECGASGKKVVNAGFSQLPSNKNEPLLRALAEKGPVAVSVDASDWFPYKHGVFDSCERDAVVNHAVLAVGYAKEWFVIRNSWGSHWGEQGHIRLLRVPDVFCGVDRKPQEGSGCEGGPSEVTVCGMCGVLSDSSYPLDVRLA